MSVSATMSYSCRAPKEMLRADGHGQQLWCPSACYSLKGPAATDKVAAELAIVPR
jgi:hypothetical protein